MANQQLNTPLVLQAQRIDVTMLPSMFSPTYAQYVIQQGQDTQQVVQRTNDAASAVYEEQQKNEEQDEKISNQETRLASAEETLVETVQRVDHVEQELTDHEERITGLETDVAELQDTVETLQEDYVSKSATAQQSLDSPLSVSTSYSIDGVKVVGSRVAGFTPATGTALLGGFNADQQFSVSDPPTQSEVQAIASALVASRQRIKALEDALRLHGLIE